MPTNSVLTVHNQTVMVHPIVDQFYDHNPCHVRSSDYVQTKGLVSNEKAAPRYPGLIGPPLPPSAPTDAKPFPSIQPNTIAGASRSLTPDLPLRSSTVVMTGRLPRRPTSLPESHAVSSLSPSLSLSAASLASTPSPSLSAAHSASSSRTPVAQGNISRKRASLQALERARLGFAPFAPVDDDLDDDPDDLFESPSPSEDPPPRTEFGNPTKLARFFPELTLS